MLNEKNAQWYINPTCPHPGNLNYCYSIINKGKIGVLHSFVKPEKVITEPGVYFRYPYPLNSMEILDGRLILLEPKPTEFLTSDKKT